MPWALFHLMTFYNSAAALTNYVLDPAACSVSTLLWFEWSICFWTGSKGQTRVRPDSAAEYGSFPKLPWDLGKAHGHSGGRALKAHFRHST